MKLAFGFLTLILSFSMMAVAQGSEGSSGTSVTEGGSTEVGFYCKTCKGYVVGGHLIPKDKYEQLLNTSATGETFKPGSAGAADGTKGP